MNRYRDFVKRWAARRSRGEMSDTGRGLLRRDGPPNRCTRARGQRTGKVAADRCNQ